MESVKDMKERDRDKGHVWDCMQLLSMWTIENL